MHEMSCHALNCIKLMSCFIYYLIINYQNIMIFIYLYIKMKKYIYKIYKNIQKFNKKLILRFQIFFIKKSDIFGLIRLLYII